MEMDKTAAKQVISKFIARQARIDDCTENTILYRLTVGLLVSGNSVLDLIEAMMDKGGLIFETEETLAEWVDRTDYDSIDSSLSSLLDAYEQVAEERNQIIAG